jgi:hypothetical protein
MPVPPKPRKKKYTAFGVEITEADERRDAADRKKVINNVAAAAKPKPPAPKVISDEAKRRSASKQSIGAASKKGVKGRRGNIDKMIDNF